MSECVVRMEMPKNCYECEMHGAWAFCPIGKWPVVGYKKQRHEDCPIICQLPEGHGRLVDADAHIDDMKKHLWDWSSVDGITATTVLKQAISDLENAPTIIPADEYPAYMSQWLGKAISAERSET